MRATSCGIALGALLVGGCLALGLSTSGRAQGNGGKSSDQDAEAVGTPAFESMFGQFGLKVRREIAGTKCSVDSDLDASTFISSIPMLQGIGLLNRDVTQTQINTEPTRLELAFSIQMAPLIIQPTFERQPQPSNCVFRQFLDDADDLGNDRRRLLFSYAFSNALSGKVNWDKFQALNITKIAPRFRVEPWAMQTFMEESSQ